jgi:hypothetical protein
MDRRRNVPSPGSLELVGTPVQLMDSDTLFVVAFVAVALIIAIGKLIDWIVRRFPN